MDILPPNISVYPPGAGTVTYEATRHTSTDGATTAEWDTFTFTITPNSGYAVLAYKKTTAYTVIETNTDSGQITTTVSSDYIRGGDVFSTTATTLSLGSDVGYGGDGNSYAYHWEAGDSVIDGRTSTYDIIFYFVKKPTIVTNVVTTPNPTNGGTLNYTFSEKDYPPEEWWDELIASGEATYTAKPKSGWVFKKFVYSGKQVTRYYKDIESSFTTDEAVVEDEEVPMEYVVFDGSSAVLTTYYNSYYQPYSITHGGWIESIKSVSVWEVELTEMEMVAVFEYQGGGEPIRVQLMVSHDTSRRLVCANGKILSGM